MSHRLFHFLGDTTAEKVARFRELNRAARAAAVQGPAARPAAESYYAAAKSVLGTIPGNASYADELAYTREIIDGDKSARSDYSAGQSLLARALVNSRPDDPNEDYRQGFFEGLQDGLKDLKKKVQDARDAISWRSPLVWGVIAVSGAVALSNGRKILDTVSGVFRGRRR